MVSNLNTKIGLILFLLKLKKLHFKNYKYILFSFHNVSTLIRETLISNESLHVLKVNNIYLQYLKRSFWVLISWVLYSVKKHVNDMYHYLVDLELRWIYLEQQIWLSKNNNRNLSFFRKVTIDCFVFIDSTNGIKWFLLKTSPLPKICWDIFINAYIFKWDFTFVLYSEYAASVLTMLHFNSTEVLKNQM